MIKWYDFPILLLYSTGFAALFPHLTTFEYFLSGCAFGAVYFALIYVPRMKK
jgi:hypothetical protein